MSTNKEERKNLLEEYSLSENKGDDLYTNITANRHDNGIKLIFSFLFKFYWSEIQHNN
jgi:hypothetical protein